MNMVSVSVDWFDLKRICDSGQIFRMYERGDGVFDVYSGNRHIRIRQRRRNGQQEEFYDPDSGCIICTDKHSETADSNIVDFFCTRDEFDSYWKRYFDLDRDYGAIVKEAMQIDGAGTECEGDDFSIKYESDEFIAAACRYGAGIRILHQDIWEMLISFIISQQKQIPSIRKCIEALCERFGERRCEKIPAFGDIDSDGQSIREVISEDHIWHTFPTAQAIAEGGPEGLKGLSLGYRERYIYETAVRYLSEGRPYEEVESMGLEAASEYFKSFCGVGEKVANCICLFGAGYVDAFPIDTHIKDILYREYYLKDGCSDICDFGSSRKDTGKDNKQYQETGNIVVRGRGKDDTCEIKEQIKLTQSDYEELVRLHFDRFKGYRGIVQQWIFAWELVRGKN